VRVGHGGERLGQLAAIICGEQSESSPCSRAQWRSSEGEQVPLSRERAERAGSRARRSSSVASAVSSGDLCGHRDQVHCCRLLARRRSARSPDVLLCRNPWLSLVPAPGISQVRRLVAAAQRETNRPGLRGRGHPLEAMQSWVLDQRLARRRGSSSDPYKGPGTTPTLPTTPARPTGTRSRFTRGEG
jgi:hypothetical protein